MLSKFAKIALSLAALLWAAPSQSCTVALVSARASATGRPLLWKNRDSGTQDTKVARVDSRDGAHAYVAVFNASDRDCREAWTGFNDVGFAIMNSASYNLKDDNVPASEMDREGLVMALALSSCVTVDDFERLLSELPRPLGVEANFGVIDASGQGAFFETDNDSWTRYNLSEAADGILIRTNYSHSGRPGEGYGFTREANAEKLLRPYARTGSVSPELLTSSLSCSWLNTTLDRDFSDCRGFVPDRDFIPRYTTSSTVVVEGCGPTADTDPVVLKGLARDYIMWTALGYPPVAEIFPVWIDSVPEPLLGTAANGAAPASNEAKARRDKAFHRPGGEKEMYVDLGVLYNDRATGLAQTIGKLNRSTYERFSKRRSLKPKGSSLKSTGSSLNTRKQTQKP